MLNTLAKLFGLKKDQKAEPTAPYKIETPAPVVESAPVAEAKPAPAKKAPAKKPAGQAKKPAAKRPAKKPAPKA